MDNGLEQGNLIQQLLRATPENPVKLPIEPVDVELTPETKNALYAVAAILGVSAITAVIIYKW